VPDEPGSQVKGWHEYEEIHGRDNTVTGRVVVWPALESPQLGGARDISVYLPPSLASRWKAGADGLGDPGAPGDRAYPVVYFHDGQNVFDARTSFAGEWHADETLQTLAGEGLEAIAVAIPNGPARMDEYNPWVSQVDWRGRSAKMGGKGDAYLAWLVDTIKPLIDQSFPTRSDRAATGLIGSSMGGFISLYGLIAHPKVFGLAGVLSASIGWSRYKILALIDEGKLPPVRIHLDMGGREWRGMTADARRLRDVLIAKGWVKGLDLHYVEERYAIHREDAWARRLPDALRFLLADAGTGGESGSSPPSAG
jgi:predicted alpha/beta superfamily hydrolase